MGLTPEQRSLRGRIGAYNLHAQRDPRETTAAARRTFLTRSERELDPGGTLPTIERERQRGGPRLHCHRCNRTGHWVAGVGSDAGHWAHAEPAPRDHAPML